MQVGHARCICRGQWAGFRCQAQIGLQVKDVSTEEVTLAIKGHGPHQWGQAAIGMTLEELDIQELSVTFWNLNRSDQCNVLFTSRPKELLKFQGLERGNDFVFCVANGPSDLCPLKATSNSYANVDENLTSTVEYTNYENLIMQFSGQPNCVHFVTKIENDVPLDPGIIAVSIASIVFIVIVILFLYAKRDSLFVHLLLQFVCCRACYCCRKRCLRKRLQHMRKLQQQQFQQRQNQQSESSGNLLPPYQGNQVQHGCPIDDSMAFDMSVSFTSSAIGNRSSIISYRSARSIDSDVTLPPAYQFHEDLEKPTFLAPSSSSTHCSNLDVNDHFPVYNDDGKMMRMSVETSHHPTPSPTPTNNTTNSSNGSSKNSIIKNSINHRTGNVLAINQNTPKSVSVPCNDDDLNITNLISPSNGNAPTHSGCYFVPEDPDSHPQFLHKTIKKSSLISSSHVSDSSEFPLWNRTLPASFKGCHMRLSRFWHTNDEFGGSSSFTGYQSDDQMNSRHKQFFFRPIHPLSESFQEKDPPRYLHRQKSLDLDLMSPPPPPTRLRLNPISPPNSQHHAHHYDTSTFPRRKSDWHRHSLTLPIVTGRRRQTDFYPNYQSHHTFVPETLPSDKEMAMTQQLQSFDLLQFPNYLTHPSSTLVIHPEDSTPSESNTSTSTRSEKTPRDDEAILSRKRPRSRIGSFDFNLPFRKMSFSSMTMTRPQAVHWEDEIRDFTSPLVLERGSKQRGNRKKRPRPLSLPPMSESMLPTSKKRLSISSKQGSRRQNPIFEGHPSLHVLPPFVSGEEEEEEEEEMDKEKNEKKDTNENGFKGVDTRFGNKNHKGEPAVNVNKVETKLSADENPNKKKIPTSTSRHSFKNNKLSDVREDLISSFEDDVTNLVTPFICNNLDEDVYDTNDTHNENNENDQSNECTSLRKHEVDVVR